MSPGLTADVSAHIGVFIATLLIAMGVIGIATTLIAVWVAREFRKSISDDRD